MKDVMPGSIEGGRRCIAGVDRNRMSRGNLPVPRPPKSDPPRALVRFGPKKFAEPVSLSSTASVDFPLPGTALGLGFDLLALCARRKTQSNVLAKRVKGSENDIPAICENFFFQHFHSRFCNLWTALWIGLAVDSGRREKVPQFRRFNGRAP